MAKDIKEELRELKYEFQLSDEVPCSEEETKKYKEYLQNDTPLPKGISYSTGTGYGVFYKNTTPELTEEEKQEYFMLKQLKSINTIKNCLVFLTSLTVISIVATVLFFLSNS